MKSLLETVASIVGVLTAVFLALSVSHEYGYFFLIGSHFQTFLSTSDYFSNAILWLPFLIVGYAQYDWNQLREDREPKKRSLREWRTWIWPALGVLWLSLLTITTRWPPTPGYLGFILILFILFWSAAWRGFVLLLPSTEEDIVRIGRFAIRLGVPLLAASFVLGWYNASDDLTRLDDVYIVRLKNRDQPDLRIILRNFDKGLLMKSASSKTIEFRRWEEISAIERSFGNRSRSFICWTLDWCFGVDAKPPAP